MQVGVSGIRNRKRQLRAFKMEVVQKKLGGMYAALTINPMT